MGLRVVGLILALLAGPLAAQERSVQLEAPPEMVATGVFDYILPRFRLKTQIGVTLEAPGTLVITSDTAKPVFSWNGTAWGLAPDKPESAAAQRLADWFRSEVGLRTLMAYEGAAFSEPLEVVAAVEEVPDDPGAAREGDRLAHLHCGRCHVVSERNRMGGIGSTPSFGAMKNFVDWEAKFAAFFTLNPHPAFTQIETLTEPFDVSRPPAIAPVEMTVEEYEAILAYVRILPVKDLGAAIIAK